MFSMMSPALPTSGSDKDRSPLMLTNERPTTPENVIEPSLNSHSDDNIAASDDENELVIDQPVDFSNTTAKTPVEPKQKKIKTKSLESLKMSTPMMGTWEEQLANLAKAAQKNAKDDVQDNHEDENKDPAQISLTATTMGLDIAAQLKSHFLASLPTQSYAWLNGLGGGGQGVPPNTPQDAADKIRERTPLGGIK